MASGAQVVAAAAGGAVIAIAAMLAVSWYAIRQRADRQRRIDTAVSAIVGGVKAVRQQQAENRTPQGQSAGSVVELRAKAHLRLMAQSGPGRGAPPARADCSGPRRGR